MSLKDTITRLKSALLGEESRDGFVLKVSSPDHRWQQLFSEFLDGLPRPIGTDRIKFADRPSVKAILAAAPAEQMAALEALVRRRLANEHAFHAAGRRSADVSDCSYALGKLTVFLLRRDLAYTPAQVASLISTYLSARDHRFLWGDAPALLKICEQLESAGNISADLREAIRKLAAFLNPANHDDDWEGAPERRTREDFERLLLVSTVQQGAAKVSTPARAREKLDGRDAWARAISEHLFGLDDTAGRAWDTLIAHARTATQTKASAKWLKEADRLLAAVDKEKFKTRITEWFPLVRPSVQASKLEVVTQEPMIDRNADVLKGLVWACSCFDDEAVTRAVSDLGQTVYKKLPGWGPLSAKVGNACLFTLSRLPGLAPVGQLSRLRLKVKYSMALRLIDRALQEAAEKLGMTSEELEEIAVPTYGLDEHGCLREEFGEFTAELKIVGTHETELAWIKSDGKAQRSIPVQVKEAHAADLKEFKRTIQDIEKMLPAQRDRIERILLSERDWGLDTWTERYLNHPLLSGLARRLIWHFFDGDRTTLAIWHDGQLVDVEDRPLGDPSSATRVRLWHPLGCDVATVAAWRSWLEKHEIAQPFKQAHREIYVLTDAEERTGTYSNRFAAHIIKQHQFAALARQRGWAYTLQGAFDSHNTPTLLLPRWNLAVEFWVDAATGRDATSESGIYLYLATDQVRFVEPDGTPRALAEVPALVFSEVMRDVDLFVGVCSVGNDPAWQDTGETGPHCNYWREYSFGDLSVSAITRREVLEKLLPRLKIASQCSLDQKFLVVRGGLRTYKIHLGSGNILMEPNDQYLCIVADRGSAGRVGEKVFLPFEGDNTLAVILSKTFLLANDTKITDSTIVSQIRRR